uniref:Uncharacterized protein n=1 Tax=Oryza brachyantha TaxID=4533 RepID=J3KU12_ORYBR
MQVWQAISCAYSPPCTGNCLFPADLFYEFISNINICRCAQRSKLCMKSGRPHPLLKSQLNCEQFDSRIMLSARKFYPLLYFTRCGSHIDKIGMVRTIGGCTYVQYIYSGILE